MKFIRVIKASIHSEAELLKLLKEGYKILISTENHVASIFKGTTPWGGKDIDYELAIKTIKNHSLKEVDSVASKVADHLHVYSLSDYEEQSTSNDAYEPVTKHFQYYNSDLGDWEDMELTIMEEDGKYQWIEGDGAEESDFIFNSPKEAILDYKKFVKELGNKVKGF